MARTKGKSAQRTDQNGRSTEAEGRRGTGHRNEVALGIAVAVTVLAVFFGVRFLEDRPVFGGTYDVAAEFDDAGGLLEGSSVRISGVQVGEVSRIFLLPDAQGVRVTMRIEDEVEIPQGSTAMIDGIAALDNVGVVIEPGPPGREPVSDGAVLPSGQNTSLVDRVDTTLAGAERTIHEVESLVAGTERDLSVFLSDMRVFSGEAAGLMRAERARLHQTVVDLRSTAAELDQAAAQFNRVAHEGGDSLVLAMDQLNDVMRRLDQAVGSLERSSTGLENVIARVESGEGTLGKLVYDASLYTRLDSAAVRLDGILADFQKDPGKYLERLELVDIF